MNIKRNCVLVMLTVLLSVILVGCADKKDTLKFVKGDSSLPNTQSAFYEVNIGNEVEGATIVAELWENGECTESTPLTLNRETKKLDISILVDVFRASTGYCGIFI